MSVVALASAKGSPGVTTAAVALAARWPSPRHAVVLELDPAGGDIAAWFGLCPDPGIGSLAAGARHGLVPGTLADHSQRVPGDVRVLVGPTGTEQARRAVAMLGRTLLPAFDGVGEADIVADLGRLDPESPAVDFARRADLALLVARQDVAALGHLAALVSTLGPVCRSVGLVIVGRSAYPLAEISDAIGADVLGVLPHDAEGAALVVGGRHDSLAGRRSALMRSASDLAAVVVETLNGGEQEFAGPERLGAAASANGAGPRATR